MSRFIMGQPQSALSDDDAAPFFALQIDEDKKRGEAHTPLALALISQTLCSDVGQHEPGWNNALPEDVFVHSFSFLSYVDLAHVCSINQSWRAVANDSALWKRLDLSRIYSRGDILCSSVLSSRPLLQSMTFSCCGC
jgi:hypothetical protein